jgi:hypothetical protein
MREICAKAHVSHINKCKKTVHLHISASEHKQKQTNKKKTKMCTAQKQTKKEKLLRYATQSIVFYAQKQTKCIFKRFLLTFTQIVFKIYFTSTIIILHYIFCFEIYKIDGTTL